jgi:transcriptional regulator with XRE-family HTH domain
MVRRLTGATTGARVREAYVRANLNRNQLSKLADLDYAQIMKIERGEADPKVETLERIAHATGVTVGDLLGQDVPPSVVVAEEPLAFREFAALYGPTLRPALTEQERATLITVPFHRATPEKYLVVLQLMREGAPVEPTSTETAAQKKGGSTPKRGR